MTTMPKRGAAEDSKVVRVEGVDMSRVNPAVVAQKLAEYKVPTKKSSTIEDKVRALARHQRRIYSEEMRADCDHCGGESGAGNVPDEDLVCPYCGVGASEVSPAATTVVTGDEGSTALVLHASAIETPIADALGKRGTLRELDKAVRRIEEIKVRGARCYWELGQELLIIAEKKLWLERRNERNDPIHGTFAQFVAAETGFTVQYANMMMRVAKTFTKEEVEKVGVRKLSVIVKLTDGELRKELAEKMKAGALTLSQLELDLLDDLMPKNDPAVDDTDEEEGTGTKKGKEKPSAAKSGKPEPAKGLTTVVFEQPKTRVGFFTTKDPKKQATMLNQDPVAKIKTANGQEIRIALSRKAGSGQIFAVIEITKSADD